MANTVTIDGETFDLGLAAHEIPDTMQRRVAMGDDHQAYQPTTKDKRQYQIIDSHTSKVVATVTGLIAARRAVDKRDNAYGAYRYTHKRID